MIVAAVVAVMLQAGSLPGPSSGPSTPGSDALGVETLSRRHRARDWLRVTMDTTRLETRVRVIDAWGLRGLSVRHPERPHVDEIPWADIDRLDLVSDRRSYGRIAGGLLGGLGAMLIPLSRGDANSEEPFRYFMTGQLAGMYLGGRWGRHAVRERAIYVAPGVAPAPDVRGQPSLGLPSSAASPRASTDSAAPPPTTLSASPAAVRAVSEARVRAALRRIQTRDLLRIEGDFGLFVGHAAHVSFDGFSGLRADPPVDALSCPESLSWDHVFRVDKRGHSAKVGAKHGAAALGLGAGVMSVLLLAVVENLGGELHSGEVALWCTAGAAVGAGVGGLFGGAAGAAVPRWHSLYERQ